MKYILANQWLRNILLLSTLLVAIYLSSPFNITEQEYAVLLSLATILYLSSWLNNRLLERYVMNNRKMWVYFVALPFLIAIMTASDYGANQIIPQLPESPWNLTQGMLSSMMFLVVGFGINSAYRQIIHRQTVLEQELITKRNELRFLQNQVNPHFLFNSLNNLYSASITEPEKVKDRILQMAELLRYQLASSKSEFVPLEEEVNFLLNYLDIEKRRLGRQMNLAVETVGDFSHKKITPLLVLPFLENAFKYSTGGTAQAEIQVQIVGLSQAFRFHVSNTIPQNMETLPASTGIGIENVQKRLELLYPDQHVLMIQANKNTFDIDLEIRMAP